MKAALSSSVARHGLCALLAATVLAPVPAAAQSLADIARQMDRIQQEVADQRAVIDGQSRRIAEQEAEIARLRAQLASAAPAPARPVEAVPIPPRPEVAAALPDRPVGEQPQQTSENVERIADLAGVNVLSGAGRIVLEPSLEYSNSASNRLVFRGVELAPGIQIGLIEASNVDRNTMVAAATVRYGITDNLEFEARVPYVLRSDRLDRVQQANQAIVQQALLKEDGIGDVEVGLRYQLNHPVGEEAIFIGSLMVKTPTGKSPYDVAFDQFGVAQGLATGSGFWAVQPGINFLVPSDPVVIFGGAGYVYQIPRNIDRTVGGVLIGRVDPGDAITANLGFGFALNQRFSFSLGYKHTYLFATKSELNGVTTRSNRIQAGVLELGMAYRLTERETLNFSIGVGATQDAPALTFTLRMPLSVN